MIGEGEEKVGEVVEVVVVVVVVVDVVDVVAFERILDLEIHCKF